MHESLLECNSHASLDGGALLSSPADRFRRGHGVAQLARIRESAVRVFQPLLQEGLQLAHVLEAEV